MGTTNLFPNFTATMRRLPYVFWTGILLSATYLLLRIVRISISGGAYDFPDPWQFLDPLGLIAGDGDRLWIVLALHGALTMGLVLTAIRRARDAGWRTWIALLMIIPVVRLFVFTALAIVPSQQHTDALDLPRYGSLDRIIPRSSVGSASAAVLISLIVVLPLGFIDVHVLNDYGLALFIGLPFLLGAVSASLFNYHDRRTLKKSIGVAMLTVTITLVMIFILAMEGLMCLVMAAPIVYVIALSGALIGHALAQNVHGRAPAMILLVLLAPLLMAFEAASDIREPVFKVITSVRVNAPAQDVWNELVAFSRMDEPEEFLFKAGISYPIEARINGEGVGAMRYCEFNTGPFVEPITVWNEPMLLAFDVLEDPPPMTEISIYEHINAPHVEGFFRSTRGQFKLTEQVDGTTLLEGTTWYTHDIWPAWYWRAWSDAILHRIHVRVLDHIKFAAEANAGEAT